jgi:hypothetical protein
MANLFKYKLLLISGLILTFTLLSFRQESEMKGSINTWGFFGHKRINRIAVFTLPPEMFGFYKEHIEYITEHAVDPDKRRYAVKGEAECHFIDIDHYGTLDQNPFEIVPRTWTKAVEKFSEDTLRAYGIVPWNIQFMKKKLQVAFENKNIDLILKYSADIGHYIGDAHVPLHTTENYNGQLTGQRGIHGLWESRLVEINAESYDYFIGKSSYIKNPLDFTWAAVQQSHYGLDSVLRFEKELTKQFPEDKKYAYEQRGNMTIQTYSYEFSQAYHLMLNGMVERRMRAAILAVGSFWYTAWVDAGQPDLSKLQNIPPSSELLKEIAELEALYQKGEQKGRDCDH